MAVLDLAAIETAEIHDDPYRHAVVRHSFVSEAIARRLRDEFARDGFTRSERHETAPGGKRYLMYNRHVIVAGEPVADNVATLSATWQQLIGELLQPRYRAALAELTGADLAGCTMEARLDRYGEGCWIEPHTDRPDKVVTQLLYFNDPWLSQWNGEFRVLRGPRFEACARRVLPRLGTSVIMRRCERSWHGVPPVTPGSGQQRLSLLVHF
ncbi:MAG: 2OG-Fe(II) oxygenase, partial [Mycobacteriaceae bacterium]|nr:2OG-Fe(II) oxygenase [Mycobacteriaceae bacterium]